MKYLIKKILFCSIITLIFGCQKEKNLTVHNKIIEKDITAFHGTWKEYKRIVWGPSDNYTETSPNKRLKITESKWISHEGEIDITFFYGDNYYSPFVIFHRDNIDDTIFIKTYNNKEKIKFKIYEYPNDPNIFRIDRHYKKALLYK